jgi:uncharacterized small protein (DUF1192 family)
METNEDKRKPVSAHTPTPWKLERLDDPEFEYGIIEFLFESVNSHATLVARVEELERERDSLKADAIAAEQRVQWWKNTTRKVDDQSAALTARVEELERMLARPVTSDSVRLACVELERSEAIRDFNDVQRMRREEVERIAALVSEVARLKDELEQAQAFVAVATALQVQVSMLTSEADAIKNALRKCGRFLAESESIRRFMGDDGWREGALMHVKLALETLGDEPEAARSALAEGKVQS